MKPLLLTAAVMVMCILHVSAQRTCGFSLDMNVIQQTDPERYHRLMQIEQRVANYVNARQMNPMLNGTVITIPVVVHVLHTGQSVGTGLNISSVQVQSQIDVLNRDFRRLNADAANTPVDFQGVAADVEFQFVLACIDPDGNPTNGIVRVATTNSSFTITDTNGNNRYDLAEEQSAGIKFAPTGSPAWPPDRYLNIWVCKLANGLLGYAQFPDIVTTQPQTDGVVINTTSFGDTGNVSAPYDKGRTTTHEIGHWMGLRHIWGDAPCGNDFVADTPTQSGPNYNCPSHPHASCGSNDMFMNYMDYTNDACMNLFTQGQADRMWSFFELNAERESFVNCTLIAQVCHTAPTITGPSQICTSGNFAINNSPQGATLTWSSSNPTGLSINSTTGVATRQNNFNGQVTITASITGACNAVETIKNVNVGNYRPLGTSSYKSKLLG